MKKALTLVLALAMVLALVPCFGVAEDMIEIELLSGNAFEGNVYDGMQQDNFVEQYVRDAIGVDIKYTYTDDLVTTRNMRLMSGDIPDIIAMTNRNYLVNFAKEDYLLNLDKYADQLSDAFSFTAGNSASGKVDGVTYAIAGRPYGFRIAMWYDVNMFNAAGITELPTTLDGFFDAVRTVMKSDFDGNGIEDTLGLSGFGGMATLQQIFGAYGVTMPNVLTIDENGDVVDTMFTQNFYDALSYAADLWKEGIIDTEIFTLNSSQVVDKMSTEKTAVAYVQWPSIKKVGAWASVLEVDPDACWEIVGPLTGPDGVTNYVGNYASQGFTSLYSLNAELEDDPERLEAALKVLNFFGTEEGLMLTTYGIQGQHWDYNEEGVPTVFESAYSDIVFSWIYQLCGREEMSYCRVKFGEDAWKYVVQSDEQPWLDDVTSLVDDPEWYNGTDAETYIKEECAKFLTGENDLNPDNWQKFLDTLNSTYRYSEFIAAANAQWHEMVG